MKIIKETLHIDNKVIMESVSCCNGCDGNDKLLFTGRDLMHSIPGVFNVVSCSICGLIRTNPRPSPQSMSIYYPDNYGPYLSTIVKLGSQNTKNRFKTLIKPLLNRIFNSLGTALPLQNPGSMVELGCASGAFLHQMAEKGWRVQGIEFSKKASKEVQKLGFPVHVGTLESAPNPKEPYDLIVAWMVLEHLHDPVASLKKLRNWAKPETWLALSVPNAASLEFKLFKERSFALQLPTHLYHFTPISLEKVLKASGWKIEKLYHQRTLNNLIGSFGYFLQHKGYIKLGNKLIELPEKGGIIIYALYPIAWIFSIFGQTGRMTVWAKKI